MAGKSRKRKTQTEYQKTLRAYRKVSSRHVLIVEADLTEDQKREVFGLSEYLRHISNLLTGCMWRNIGQLTRTKKYRVLKKQYAALKKQQENTSPKSKQAKKLQKSLKSVGDQMSRMQEQYNVTYDYCRQKAAMMANGTNDISVFVLSVAEDVWTGVEKILYDGASKLHFKRFGDHPTIRAKQIERGITVKSNGDKLLFGLGNLKFTNKPGDRFVTDEVKNIISYLGDKARHDKIAADNFANGVIVDTFRPCYATLVCEEIRGKLRVYVHITMEGKALPKYRKDGSLRHKYGQGRVGVDIGTQTYAWTTENEVGLSNLAERGKSALGQERQERVLYRKMDRSRRAMNPDNYNDDGTIKKKEDLKPWKTSNRYRLLRKKHSEMCRKCSVNRKLSNNEAVNMLRSKADIAITESMSWKGLQKKAKADHNAQNISDVENNSSAQETKTKCKRRKRFGKSIRSRSPGYFQHRLKEVFEATGGKYVEVPWNYRASQYDHTSGVYEKKPLSRRIFVLSDGTRVQRDWYSSFLLCCGTNDCSKISRRRCNTRFPQMLERHNKMIEEIRSFGKKILNSGIKP